MKPKKLVVVRFRQDRQKWECDYRVPTAMGSKRLRPLFDDEVTAVEHANKMTKELNAGAPVATVAKDVTLKDYSATWLEARRGIVEARSIKNPVPCGAAS